jgi:hypothetical protein
MVKIHTSLGLLGLSLAVGASLSSNHIVTAAGTCAGLDLVQLSDSRTWSGGTDRASSYWCTNRLEIGSQTKLVLSVLPLGVLVSRDDEVVVLLELRTLLNVAGVAGHGR